jgi:hypothetical protein
MQVVITSPPLPPPMTVVVVVMWKIFQLNTPSLVFAIPFTVYSDAFDCIIIFRFVSGGNFYSGCRNV